MFSFFKSKKHSPDQAPADPIPGPVPPAPKEDDFIFIERKGSAPGSNTGSPSHGLYPPIPGRSAPPSVVGSPTAITRQQSEDKTLHAMHGVPFKLSPELVKDSSTEITQYQVNEILAFIGKTTNARLDYDFSLERSVLSQG
ncbi:uncharacterized protein LOC129738969 [Uranotaenia lowii]|uniref:uncharacterized protein LOC129738969 n=1 Tax=Uranotaenia lowii TaxID=190385 RepID=UPI002479CF11|nr:uncharacterized protein LOC129738969 [Uranotaenia lowii]